jgi:hypothetical protein
MTLLSQRNRFGYPYSLGIDCSGRGPKGQRATDQVVGQFARGAHDSEAAAATPAYRSRNRRQTLPRAAGRIVVVLAGSGPEMISEPESDAPYEGDPIGPGLFTGLRRISATKRGRNALLLVVGIVGVIVIFVIGLVIFSAMSSESQSYKDGYSVGGAVYAADGVAELDAQQACQGAERRGSHQGGLPPADNAEQWQQGCVAGFGAAQSDN